MLVTEMPDNAPNSINFPKTQSELQARSRSLLEKLATERTTAQVLTTARSGGRLFAATINQAHIRAMRLMHVNPPYEIRARHEPYALNYITDSLETENMNTNQGIVEVCWLASACPYTRNAVHLVRNPIDVLRSIYECDFLHSSNPYGCYAARVLRDPLIITHQDPCARAARYYAGWLSKFTTHEYYDFTKVIRVEDLPREGTAIQFVDINRTPVQQKRQPPPIFTRDMLTSEICLARIEFACLSWGYGALDANLAACYKSATLNRSIGLGNATDIA